MNDSIIHHKMFRKRLQHTTVPEEGKIQTYNQHVDAFA